MGYWENTTYVRHGDVRQVVETLDQVFAREGMRRVVAPAARARSTVEPMQYDGALENDLWALAVFPGAPGWTVLKTAPLELLSERPDGSDRMRLATVCEALAASAFQLNVYDSSNALLVEVSPAGRALISGYNAPGSDPMEWRGMALDEERVETGFELHDLDRLLRDGAGEDFAQHAAREIGGRNAPFCDNAVSVVTLIGNEPFVAPDGLALYYRWDGPSRQRRVPSATFEQYVRR